MIIELVLVRRLYDFCGNAARLNFPEFCAVAEEVSMTSKRLMGSPFQKENSQ